MEASTKDLRLIESKISSKRDFIDLFSWFSEQLHRQAGLYIMPIEYLTWNFIRAFLAGEKKLLRKKELNSIDNVPKLTSLPCDHLWQLIKQDTELSLYFDVSSSKFPGKRYMLDVCFGFMEGFEHTT